MTLNELVTLLESQGFIQNNAKENWYTKNLNDSNGCLLAATIHDNNNVTFGITDTNSVQLKLFFIQLDCPISNLVYQQNENVLTCGNKIIYLDGSFLND